MLCFSAPRQIVPHRCARHNLTPNLPQAAAKGPKDGDYQVADISLADFGRKEIELAEVRVPETALVAGTL